MAFELYHPFTLPSMNKSTSSVGTLNNVSKNALSNEYAQKLGIERPVANSRSALPNIHKQLPNNNSRRNFRTDHYMMDASLTQNPSPFLQDSAQLLGQDNCDVRHNLPTASRDYEKSRIVETQPKDYLNHLPQYSEQLPIMSFVPENSRMENKHHYNSSKFAKRNERHI